MKADRDFYDVDEMWEGDSCPGSPILDHAWYLPEPGSVDSADLRYACDKLYRQRDSQDKYEVQSKYRSEGSEPKAAKLQRAEASSSTPSSQAAHMVVLPCQHATSNHYHWHPSSSQEEQKGCQKAKFKEVKAAKGPKAMSSESISRRSLLLCSPSSKDKRSIAKDSGKSRMKYKTDALMKGGEASEDNDHDPGSSPQQANFNRGRHDPNQEKHSSASGKSKLRKAKVTHRLGRPTVAGEVPRSIPKTEAASPSTATDARPSTCPPGSTATVYITHYGDPSGQASHSAQKETLSPYGHAPARLGVGSRGLPGRDLADDPDAFMPAPRPRMSGARPALPRGPVRFDAKEHSKVKVKKRPDSAVLEERSETANAKHELGI